MCIRDRKEIILSASEDLELPTESVSVMEALEDFQERNSLGVADLIRDVSQSLSTSALASLSLSVADSYSESFSQSILAKGDVYKRQVKNLVLNRPELVIEEETIDFKVQEQKNDKLPAGQTRVLQEGQKGIRVHLIEVENGKRTEKESYDKVIAQDRIVEVGTAGETTKPVPQEATKPQVSEKADTKEIASSKANQDQKEQLPNTGSAESQAALAAGLAILGLGAGLAAVSYTHLTTIFVPWSKEIKITQLSSCGLSETKSVKPMVMLTLLQRLNA